MELGLVSLGLLVQHTFADCSYAPTPCCPARPTSGRPASPSDPRTRAPRSTRRARVATASSAAPIGPGASSALGGSTWPRRGGRSTRRGAAACVETRGSVLKAPSPKPRLGRARARLLRLPRTRPVALGSSYLSRRAAGPTSAAQPGLRVLERAVSKVADTTLPLTTQACGYVTYSHHPSGHPGTTSRSGSFSTSSPPPQRPSSPAPSPSAPSWRPTSSTRPSSRGSSTPSSHTGRAPTRARTRTRA